MKGKDKEGGVLKSQAPSEWAASSLLKPLVGTWECQPHRANSSFSEEIGNPIVCEISFSMCATSSSYKANKTYLQATSNLWTTIYKLFCPPGLSRTNTFLYQFLLLMPQPPPHQLQIRRISILLSLCPPLIVHSPNQAGPSSPRQSVLSKVLPVSWPRCRDFRIRHLFMASRPPSWFLALLCSFHSCNYAFYGTSSLYSPGIPRVSSSLLFPLSYTFLPCQFYPTPQHQVLPFVGDSLYL